MLDLTLREIVVSTVLNDVSVRREVVSKLNNMLTPLSDNLAMEAWESAGFSAPPPPEVKRFVLMRHNIPGSAWVETGTFKGETSKFLSTFAQFVYTIEPDNNLFKYAKESFKNINNIQAFLGSSESVLPKLLEKIKFSKICFWLDGHFSGSGTYKGENDTPIIMELNCLKEFLLRNVDAKVAILIDDLRLFTGKVHKYGPYPKTDQLVDWSRELNLSWSIEHDIFIAKRL